MCVESICTRSRESCAGAGARAAVRSRRHLSGGGHDYSSLLPRRAAKSTIVAAVAAGQRTLRAAAAAAAAVRRARCRWVVARRSGRSPGEPVRAGPGRAGTDRGRDAAMRLLRGSRRGQSDAARRTTTVISRRFVAPFSRALRRRRRRVDSRAPRDSVLN